MLALPGAASAAPVTLQSLIYEKVVAWLSGSVLVSINEHCYSTPGPVNTWMGDRLWVGKPCQYVTSHLGQLSLPSLRGR